MSVEVAGMIASTVSALGTMIQVWQNARKAERFPTTEEIAQASSIKPLTAAQKQEALELTRVIPIDLLEVILNNIQRAYDQFKKALSDPNCLEACKEQEEGKVIFTVCKEAERIKRFNNGTIPPLVLQEWGWLLDRC